MLNNNQEEGILDLFCGPGGLSLGFMHTGFDIVLSTDIDANSIETVKTNHEKISESMGKDYYHKALHKDINDLSVKEVKKIFKDKNKKLIGIIGGPPCKGFSMANMQTRFIDNPHNGLFREYIRLVKGLKPKFFVFENVMGLLSMNNGKIKDEIFHELKEIGYLVDSRILNASDYGVPQNRKRVIIIGYKKGEKILFPKKTHGKEKNLKPKVTVADALFDLPKLSSGQRMHEAPYPNTKRSEYADSIVKTKEFGIEADKILNHITTKNGKLVLKRYKHIPEGGNWSNAPKSLFLNYSNQKKCHSSIYKRLDSTKPSITVSNFRKSMFIHPKQDRGLSVREAARLQSFPDWYEIKGTINAQQQQIADAVPPMMGKAIAESVKKMMENE